MMKSLLKYLLFSLSILMISACGGGGGSDDTDPIVNPQPDPDDSGDNSDDGSGDGDDSDPQPEPDAKANKPILVFSKTAGYRHESISAGQTMLTNIADNMGWQITFSEDSNDFNSSNLTGYSLVIWLNTTGDVLNSDQQQAFKDFVESGGGYLGIHAASDTEYSWSWYGDLVGAYFSAHPHVQSATLNIEDDQHPATEHLAENWTHTDEWYNFQQNPRANVNVLMALDETSYEPGNGAMGDDHPITWYHLVGEGRSFYTGLGHTQQTYQQQDFIDHIAGAMMWAGQLAAGTPVWNGAAPSDADFTNTVLASSINQPMELDISAAGDIYIIGREGQFYAMEDGELAEKSVLNVNASHEGGLIGFALDPDFSSNRFGYFHYTDTSLAQHNVSRIPIKTDNTLDLAAEQILLSFAVQIDECCHVAGSMDFDSEGNLYIAVGDNTNPFASDGYTPIDERPGRSAWDAQKSSSNSNDLRGKILRIKPTADGYTIPAGNLFAQDEQHRAEIYTMGHRNPFRIAIDPSNDNLLWGEIGPDAGGSNASRGPAGYDELNITDSAGNFGWPYFSGNNEAYRDYDFATSVSGAAFDASNVINDSPNNTGASNLPNAKPAWVTMSHRALMVAGVYRWDNSVEDEYKLPSYFDGRLIYWNFNNDEMFEASVEQSEPTLRRWLDTSVMAGIIDGVISPHNNRLYLISFGGNCCGKPNDAGLLVEVKYTPNNAGSTDSAENTYAINAGGAAVNAADGTFYQADDFFSGGHGSGSSLAISGTDNDRIYQSHHWQEGGFSYHLPIDNGDYQLTLEFAETYFNNAGLRVFNVDAENSQIISQLDVFATVGAASAYQVVSTVTVSDGSLDLQFIPVIENPMVSGIKVIPVSRFVAGDAVTFIAAVNGQYVTNVDGQLSATQETAAEAETFILVDAGNGFVALQSSATGNYVTVLPDGRLAASASSVSEHEWFTLVENDDGSFALKAAINGLFVAVDDGATGALIANRESVDLSETFIINKAEVCNPDFSYAIACRPNAKAYLDMPKRAAVDLSNVPALLSQTGAFSDVANLTPSSSLIPFAPIAPLWSDRAVKQRWVSVPSGEKVQWQQQGKWQWPAGTVFVKHFSLPTREQDASAVRRLETRLLVIGEQQKVYGVTYQWREDNSDADLLTSGNSQQFTIHSSDGDWTQTWMYPSPSDCLNCHNDDAENVLGVKTASLNSNYQYPSDISDNQLRTLNHLGLFTAALNEADISAFPAHAHINDESKTLTHRVRSYWDINCASCHGPQGIAALWDGRYETPLADQGVIDGELANQRDYFADYGLVDPKVVDPGNINNSIMYIRDKSSNASDRMPPLGRLLEDSEYMAVLERWINSLE
ncbi:ThuA domain-containing protein [Thalassotalea sp. Y01]|uniref:ThuA domain-containing protein n=1 Tax=Thalassotalea sp. Y01 TaxID=2729613 RepID=UPI00145E5BF6|nr:ThuA domain-containing protein [Thalassotalea sp. Y01]NMP16917.1 hypothetical protein [Thalassotalea sp. Y01]